MEKDERIGGNIAKTKTKYARLEEMDDSVSGSIKVVIMVFSLSNLPMFDPITAHIDAKIPMRVPEIMFRRHTFMNKRDTVASQPQNLLKTIRSLFRFYQRTTNKAR